MAAPLYSTADYLAALQGLLPRGRAWPRESDAVLTKLLTGFASSYAASNASANKLLADAFPATADSLAPEWESSLGLPGLFGVTPTTLTGRRAAIVAALIDVGGQSKPYFISLAAALGITITITEFVSHSVTSAVNVGINGPEWSHAWQVNAPISAASTGVTPNEIIQAVPGTGNAMLEAVLARAKPAHTVCIASYT